jgi:hypothetical protein
MTAFSENCLAFSGPRPRAFERFSVEYRALFGEMPSASLRRAPDEALGRKSWN